MICVRKKLFCVSVLYLSVLLFCKIMEKKDMRSYSDVVSGSDTQCIMGEICNKLKECFKRGYQAITDLEDKENKSYDAIEADIEEMNTKWSTLEEETRVKIKETIEYFSEFRENDPEEGRFDTIKEEASRLKADYVALSARHTELKSYVKVDPVNVQTQYNHSKTMKDKITTHGRNALVVTTFLGMILGGIIAWKTYNEQTIPIVFGVLIGGGAAIIIGGLFYFIFTGVATRGVKRWKSLKEQIPKLETLNDVIGKKGRDLYPVAPVLLDMIINKETTVREGSEALIEQCEKYQ